MKYLKIAVVGLCKLPLIILGLTVGFLIVFIIELGGGKDYMDKWMTWLFEDFGGMNIH